MVSFEFVSSGTNLCFHCFILGKFRRFTSAWRVDRETGEKSQSTPRLEATPLYFQVDTSYQQRRNTVDC